MKSVALLLLLALAGCATTNTGIVEIDDNTYMYSKQDWMAYSGGAVKVEMFKEARDFCKAKGKKFVLLNQQSQDAALYVASAGAELQFQCV